MYTRGQFAMICNVGRKALRLYEQEGILLPSRIDPENGYHYYDTEQIEKLEKIKHYKKLGMSLDEIKSVLNGIIPEKEMLEEKKVELDHQIRDMQQLRKVFDHFPKEKEKMISYTIDMQHFPENTVLYIKENVELEKLGTSVGKLYEKAARSSFEIVGDHFVKYEGMLSGDGDFRMTTCLPVHLPENIATYPFENEISTSGICLQHEKSVTCIHIYFTGGFSKTRNAHIQMKDYVEKNSIDWNGVVYEVYRRDMAVDIYYVIN